MTLLQTLKALADDTRLRLYHLLAGGELNVNEIARVLGMGQSRVSRHLKILTEAGLLAPRRDGLWVYYAAARPPGAEPLLAAVGALLQAEPRAREDLRRAAEVLQERGRTTRRFFDSVAGSWEEMKRDILGDFDLNGAIAGLLAPCTADGTAAAGARWRTALEVGCGTGELLALLAERAGQAIGVDSSPGMLEAGPPPLRGARRGGAAAGRGGAPARPRRGGRPGGDEPGAAPPLAARWRGCARRPAPCSPGGCSCWRSSTGHGEEALRERFRATAGWGSPPPGSRSGSEAAGFAARGKARPRAQAGPEARALHIEKDRPEGG